MSMQIRLTFLVAPLGSLAGKGQRKQLNWCTMGGIERTQQVVSPVNLSNLLADGVSYSKKRYIR